jgi:hypothetical protein
MKLGSAVKRLNEAELDLAGDMRKIGERHAAEHDVYHQTRTFAGQCEQHAERLSPIAERYGTEVSDEADGEGLWESVLAAVRRRGSELTGRRRESGLVLVGDLRELYLSAQETFVTWVIVNQGALAARDMELVDVVKSCLPETELQVKWALTRIKTSAPQALTS